MYGRNLLKHSTFSHLQYLKRSQIFQLTLQQNRSRTQYVQQPLKEKVIGSYQRNHLRLSFKNKLCNGATQTHRAYHNTRNEWNTQCLRLHNTTFRTFCSNSEVSVNLDVLERYLDTLHEEYTNLSQTGFKDKKLFQRIEFLNPLMEIRSMFKQKLAELQELEDLIKGLSSEDEEIRFMAEQERRSYNNQLDEYKQEILDYMVPEERMDKNDVYLEVFAGVGGQEAMLFASELFQMYHRYAAYKNWTWEEVQNDKAELGGSHKLVAAIGGIDVYKHLKFEGGVHRVQRVPITESKGRVHTSTITLSVLPQPTEIDVVLNPKDLTITACRSSGPGGQNVNKVDTKARIVHNPTGIAVECQANKSLAQNKKEAQNRLRAILYQKQLEEQVSKEISQRKLQVGTAGRSEKIRTYNYNQDRITDHRLQKNSFNIENFLSGSEQLDNLTSDLLAFSRVERLREILDKFQESEKT